MVSWIKISRRGTDIEMNWIYPCNLLSESHYSRSILSLFFAVLLLGLVNSCSDPSEERPSHTVRIQVAGDTILVRNSWPPSPDTARLREVSTIGMVDGPEEYLLVGFTVFTVGERGEVYVADADGIRVFSGNGETVRRVAGRGQGPNEVGRVGGMAVDQMGRLLVLDETNRRVAVFDTSGTILDNWRLPAGRPGRGQDAVVPQPEGETLIGFKEPLEPHRPVRRFPFPVFLRVDSVGHPLDTIWVPDRLKNRCPLFDDAHWRMGIWDDLRELVFPKIKVAATRGGDLIFGCPADYEIERVDRSGVYRRILFDRPAARSSRDDRESFVDEWEKAFERIGREWQWLGEPPPEEIPRFQRILAGRRGRVWVWPGMPREKVDTLGRSTYATSRTGAFDVFSPEGRFLGIVSLPPGTDFLWYRWTDTPFFSGDTVWVMRRDSMDAQYISRMIVEW